MAKTEHQDTHGDVPTSILRRTHSTDEPHSQPQQNDAASGNDPQHHGVAIIAHMVDKVHKTTPTHRAASHAIQNRVFIGV